jgi:hypothetical protein
MSLPTLAASMETIHLAGSLMDMLADWPGWLVWCAAGVGALIAIGIVVCVIEATLDLDGR